VASYTINFFSGCVCVFLVVVVTLCVSEAVRIVKFVQRRTTEYVIFCRHEHSNKAWGTEKMFLTQNFQKKTI